MRRRRRTRRGKHCPSEGTEAPRDQKGRLTKHRDTETRVSVGHLSPAGKCVQWPGGAQILSLEADNCPMLGTVSLILTRILGLPQSIKIDQRLDKELKQVFTGAPAAGDREWEQPKISLLLAPWVHILNAADFLCVIYGLGIQKRPSRLVPCLPFKFHEFQAGGYSEFSVYGSCILWVVVNLGSLLQMVPVWDFDFCEVTF